MPSRIRAVAGSHRVLRAFAAVLWTAAAFPLFPADLSPESVAFFEKKIRPVLVENCYVCHGPSANPAKGGLRLDTAAGLRKGGDSGPAIVPGKPEESRLLKAISYTSLDLRMPPTGKLGDDQLTDFAAWIRMGAPDPREDDPASPQVRRHAIDFDRASKFWAFRPLTHPAPPAVANPSWSENPIDRFLLAKLEENGFAPAPPAAKRDLLRRVTFDLTGLPPTPTEVEAFLSDSSAGAYSKVVDRLLASPHYGERWARHWLDLVRYAETNGHEFDDGKLDAWRYRDYVIRAFNEDLPYDQFVREQVAGDLLPGKRVSKDGSIFASPVGTSFFWFGEVLNSATDSVKSRADEVDNQIDVMGKAFLGLTVACARCHDHKFDPIPTADYYALAGILHSTDLSEAVIDSPNREKAIAASRDGIAEANRQIATRVDAGWRASAGAYLRAAAQLLASGEAWRDRVAQAASAQRLNARHLDAWASAIAESAEDPSQPYYPLARLAPAGPAFAQTLTDVRAQLSLHTPGSPEFEARARERGDVVFEDFSRAGYPGWMPSGFAFGGGPARVLPPNFELANFQGEPLAASFGSGSDRFTGSLTSGKFRMPKMWVHVRMGGTPSGKQVKENIPIRVTLVADAFKSAFFLVKNGGKLEWQSQRMTLQHGRICYFELVDRTREGSLAVDQIVFSDTKEPPAYRVPADPAVAALARRAGSLEDLLNGYETLIREAPAGAPAWTPFASSEEAAPFLPDVEIAAAQARRRQAEEAMPGSAFGMVAMDRDPHDVRLHIRGSHKNLGEPVPRRFLQIIAGADQPPVEQGSGRLMLANWLASPENPLTARVFVNRVWKHHFGEGLVRSVDNFGLTGDRPTHPELLDYLAGEFIASGWSVKQLQRRMVLSRAYQMASEPSEASAKKDPANKLLQHMPVRRLEAEALRDSILAVSGSLNPELYGPSVGPHISKYQDGRGKPASGPLDGDGRRSLYIQVRRNFLTPMLLAFDYPLPTSTIGRRGVSTVPSQALLLMNNEFVAQQAKLWAERVAAAGPDPARRLDRMYEAAFGRSPEPWEREQVLAFVEAQASRHAQAGDGADSSLLAWADAGHVLFNSAEFLYLK